MSKIQYSVYEFLPEKLKKELLKIKGSRVNEIRIRRGCPVVVVIDGKRVVLDKICLSFDEIEKVVLKVCKNSIHAYEEQIKRGFITSDNGERIGLAGEFVKEDGKIITIKNITSLCVRIPNIVSGVSLKFYDKIYKKRLGNVLVISPSGVGKTTFIRDLALNLAKDGNNVVVVDERNEIALSSYNGGLCINSNLDVLTYSDKSFGFTQAIRTLNPSVIVTDELISSKDVTSVTDTAYGGVFVIATAHARSIKDCFSRVMLSGLEKSKVFDYYVVISIKNNERNFEYFDKNLKKICF